MDLKGAILRNFYNVGTLVMPPEPQKFFSLKVPHYQRPYKWDAERVEQLIQDWADNRLSPSPSDKNYYFAGAVVTVANPDKYQEHSLIDGQQRVTTLFLTNYINFVIIRHLILFEVERKRCGKIAHLCDALNQSAKFLFRKKELIDYFNDIAEEIKKYADDDKMDSLHIQEENPMARFHDFLWIPQYTREKYRDKKEYKKDAAQILKRKLSDDSLNLHYDRSSFNKSLVKVLSNFYLNISLEEMSITPEILNAEIMNDSELVYINALTSIVNKFYQITPKKGSPLAYFASMHALISEFLNEVQLCVIQTGATDDAYTLFEVMNDRALELDDLDLIKNQFFKEFVQKNRTLSEEELDHKIQELDKQWGDDIFSHREMRIQDKKLVTYLSTVFLTGNDTITNTKNEKYRIYLNTYLDNQKNYTSADIQRDFNIFQICFELITASRLPYKRREEESIAMEYRLDSTDFEKTLYFLNASGQDGVISGLVNFILKAISNFSPSFDLSFSRKFIQLLLKKQENLNYDLDRNFPQADQEQIKEIIERIQLQAKYIWITSMMAPNAEAPRDLAKALIKKNNIAENIDSLEVVLPPYEKFNLKDKFTEWLKQWNYDKDSSFKIKTLFARLLKFDLQNNVLINTPVVMTIDTNQIKSLELDHLVPQDSKDDGIFSFENEERELFIHSLGNMMPLPKKENIQKSDYPLEKSLKYYELSGLSKHFLLDEIEELIGAVNAGNINQITFFTKRKETLINHFNEIVRK